MNPATTKFIITLPLHSKTSTVLADTLKEQGKIFLSLFFLSFNARYHFQFSLFLWLLWLLCHTSLHKNLNCVNLLRYHCITFYVNKNTTNSNKRPMGYITHLKKVSINEHVCANYDFTIILINRKKSFYPFE